MITIQEYLLSKSKPKLNMIKATDENIHQIVKDEIKRLGNDADLNHIDVSEVTNMAKLFQDNLNLFMKEINPDVSNWNVSNVTTMKYMFSGCKKFNCDLSKWDVSKVRSMWHMFGDCRDFNQDLNSWDVSNVQDMQSMFNGCSHFNSDISAWNTETVMNMESMFRYCGEFNQDLSKWNVSRVDFYANMFDQCPIKKEFKPKFTD